MLRSRWSGEAASQIQVAGDTAFQAIRCKLRRFDVDPQFVAGTAEGAFGIQFVRAGGQLNVGLRNTRPVDA